MRVCLIALAAVMLGGCTVYKIDPIAYDDSLNTVYVLKNHDMRVDGFEKLLCEKFNEAGIATMNVNQRAAIPQDAFWVSYTGLWSWDLTLYLAHAEVDVFKNSQRIGRGYYHHRGTCWSLALTKFKSARSKMTPLYGELLKNFNNRKQLRK